MLRKKEKKGVPQVSTASLPDIVFMLLFFFMVATKMKEVTLKVEVKKPSASASTKLDDDSPVRTIYIGKPSGEFAKIYGSEPRLQLNDVLGDVRDIDAAVNDWRNEINEAEVLKLTITLKIDKNTKMGIVTDVKERLRDVKALKINYSAMKNSDN